MPTLPRWASGLVSSAFSSWFRTVTVTATEYYHPQLKKIRFSGDLSNTCYRPGQAILLKVNDTDYRNYTPCYWNEQDGIAEVLFHLHGNGPASALLSGLNEGDSMLISVPRGTAMHRKDNRHHFFFGDETALGLFLGLKQKIQSSEQQYIGLLELDPQSMDIPEQLGLLTDITPKCDFSTATANAFLDSLEPPIWERWQSGIFYLVGNARSIQHFRAALKQHQVPGRNIVTQPYWAAGKTGL